MNRKILKVVSISILASSVLIGCGGGNKLTPNLQAIKNNYTSMILRDTKTTDYEDKTIDQIMSNIISKKIAGYETYYFNDIDYQKSDDRASYPAATHLSRTKAIAVLAKKTVNNALMDIAIRLTRHWVLSNYRSVNWWYNEIGCNGNLTDIGIILFDKLDRFTQEAFRGKVGESSFYHRPQLMTHEGSNLINYIIMSLKDSVFDNNEKEFDLVKQKTLDIMKYGKPSGEGFMEDGSFHQHGTEMQTGAYGLEAVGNIGKIIVATEGTDFTIPKDNLEVISKFAIDGISGITHKGKFNFMGLNRAYTRNDANIATNATGYKELKYFLKYDDLPNKDKYKEVLDKIDSSESNFEGVKVFEHSNFIAANIDGVYMSFMTANANGRVTESTNGENQLGYNFAWGNNTCVMDTGNEYYNISPVWDYSKLPGCTSVNFKKDDTSDPDQNLMDYTKAVGNPQYSNRLPFEFTRTGKDKVTCIYNFSTREDFKKDNVAHAMCSSFKDVITDSDGVTDPNSGNAFKITCFVTNEGMAIVGSDFDIGETNRTLLNGYSDGELHTTVEQNIVSSETEKGVTVNLKQVTNGNVTYSCLNSSDSLTKTVKEQKGTYQRNNPTGVKITEEQKANVMTIDYITSNTNKNYAYSIQPKAKIDDNKVFKLAYNKDGIHAIELPNGKVAVAFYDKAHLSFDYQSRSYTLPASEFIDGKGAFKVFE